MIENGYKYLQTTYCIGQHYLILSVKSTVWFLLNINKIHKIIKGALNLKLCVSCIEMAYFSVVWLSFLLQTNRKLVIIEYHNKLRNFGFWSRLNLPVHIIIFASHGSYIVYIVSYTIQLITTCNPLFPDAGTNQDIKRGKSEERVSYSTTIKVKCIITCM